MSNKWADYVITCVTYTDDRITTVGAWTHDGLRLTDYRSLSRAAVVAALNDGSTFVTATKSQGEFTKGAPVDRCVVGGDWFIKTEPNNTAEDNLGELPRCA